MSRVFREAITELREKLGLSRAELSKLTGIPADTIVSIEIKGRSPGSDVLSKIFSAFPQYINWLALAECEYLAGQFEPGTSIKPDLAFQIIDSVDARNLDQIIINPKHIKEAIFLQSVGDDFSINIAGENTVIESSEQVNRKFDAGGKKRDSFVFGVPQHFGTAILLVLSKRENRGFSRVVLVKDDCFDLKESILNGAKSNTFLAVHNWFKETGINKFDIGTVHYKNLRILESESDELKTSDIYPSADDDAIKSLVEWRKSFK